MILRRACSIAVLAVLFSSAGLNAAPPEKMTDAEFQRFHQMVKPSKGESRWMEVDWHPSVWEARKRAAAEGKPIFIMAGSGGAPAAGC